MKELKILKATGSSKPGLECCSWLYNEVAGCRVIHSLIYDPVVARKGDFKCIDAGILAGLYLY